MKVWAGAIAYRVDVASLLDNKHDGDMMSSNSITTVDGVKEVHDHLNTVRAYVHPKGGLKASAAVDTVDRVLVGLSTRRA